MKILIFKEKHGNRYFDASTVEAIDKACKKILRERLNEGWYEPYNPGKNIKTLDEAIIAQLPAEYQEVEREKIANKLAYEKEFEKDKQFLAEVKECIESPIKINKNGYCLSYRLIYIRRYCAYENFELEDLEEA